MSSINAVIMTDGSFDGSNGHAGLGYVIRVGRPLYRDRGGCALARHVCYSSVDAEVASMLRAMIVFYRAASKKNLGPGVAVWNDCTAAVKFMQGQHIKGMHPKIKALRDRVLNWFQDDGYRVTFHHYRTPKGPPTELMMDQRWCDKEAKTYCGLGFVSYASEAKDDIEYHDHIVFEEVLSNG